MSERTEFLCRICNQIIDISAPAIVIVDDGNPMVVMQRFGAAHVLATARETEEFLDSAEHEAVYEVRRATPEILVEEILAPEQPIMVEEIVEAHSSGLYAVEPAPAIEEAEAVSPATEPDVEIVEAIVTAFSDEFGDGRASVEPEFRRPHKHVLAVSRKNVVTYGNLRVGTRIRCLVGEIPPGFSTHEALEIQIFQES
jgi:hypothetical protein